MANDAVGVKKALNLGCGRHPKGRGQIPRGMSIINHDKGLYRDYVDVAHDLRNYPWPWRDGEFDFILAFDVIEHFIDWIAFMDECWRILKPGHVIVLHTSNVEHLEQAWRAPDHKRPGTIDTFDFFDPETRWGREYPSSDRKWELKYKGRDGLELKFCMRKR